MLKHYTCVSNLFSPTMLCNIMESFEFGYMEVKNSPTLITQNILKSNILKSKTNLLTQNGTRVEWYEGNCDIVTLLLC